MIGTLPIIIVSCHQGRTNSESTHIVTGSVGGVVALARGDVHRVEPILVLQAVTRVTGAVTHKSLHGWAQGNRSSIDWPLGRDACGGACRRYALEAGAKV